MRAVPDDRPILICFAVREEARAFQKRVANHPRVRTIVHGMGNDNARRALVRELEIHRPIWVITSGFAGGLNPALANGAVIHDADPGFPGIAALQQAGSTAATFHCAKHVAVTAAEKLALRRESNCDAVEMESGIIRQLCREQRVPGATVRVISDSARDDLPLDFNRLMMPDYRMDFLKLAGTLLCSPGKIPELMRFQKRLQGAAESLAKVLAAVIAAE